MNIESLKLCLVTHRQNQPFDSYLDFIMQCIHAGVTSVQLREKNLNEGELLEMARCLKKNLSPLGVPLIINDCLEVAKQVNAEGVHLGQSDASVTKARALLGEKVWIGLSIESWDELLLANQNKEINYVAASAVFASKTKNNCRMTWGLDGLAQFCQSAQHPVVAIGGMTSSNVKEVVQCGVAGVAVISAIHDALTPSAAVSAFIQAMRS